jgi:hypothetical protein
VRAGLRLSRLGADAGLYGAALLAVHAGLYGAGLLAVHAGLYGAGLLAVQLTARPAEPPAR